MTLNRGHKLEPFFINSFNKGFYNIFKKTSRAQKISLFGTKTQRTSTDSGHMDVAFTKHKHLFPAFLPLLISRRSALKKCHVCCIFNKNWTKCRSLVKKVIVVKWMGFKTQLFSAIFPLSMIANSAPKKCYIWCILKKKFRQIQHFGKKSTPNHQEYG